jgi:hypothetical protein
MSTLEKKILISLESAGLFFLLNSVDSYKFFGNIFNMNLYSDNCPTKLGVLFNTLIFFITTYLSMGNPFKRKLFKLKNTTYGTLIFYLLSSPAIYYLTSFLNDNNSCPNNKMIIIHSILYFIILIGVMYFPE